jgi:N-acetylglucosamine kinase-like BadF-type ATPase
MRNHTAARANACLLVMDAGGTHTRALVVTPEGIRLGGAKAGPANSFLVPRSSEARNIRDAARAALASAKVPANSVEAAVIGSASVDFDGLWGEPIENALRRELPKTRLRALADAEIARHGALGGGPGVVIVSGTGSVVLGRTSSGKFEKAGGWGPLMGDEGSAQWIAQQALQAAAQAVDGTAASTDLTRVVMRYFHTRSFRKIVEPVYQQGLTPSQLGGLAPLVAQAAKQGDRVAGSIFQRAGYELARQAAEVVRRMKLPRTMVSYQGSVFLAGNTLLAPLRRSLRELSPQAELVQPLLPPIGGGFLIALTIAGYKCHDKEIANFRKTCQD